MEVERGGGPPRTPPRTPFSASPSCEKLGFQGFGQTLNHKSSIKEKSWLEVGEVGEVEIGGERGGEI
jgi:hypothetical protein